MVPSAQWEQPLEALPAGRPHTCSAPTLSLVLGEAGPVAPAAQPVGCGEPGAQARASRMEGAHSPHPAASRPPSHPLRAPGSGHLVATHLVPAHPEHVGLRTAGALGPPRPFFSCFPTRFRCSRTPLPSTQRGGAPTPPHRVFFSTSLPGGWVAPHLVPLFCPERILASAPCRLRSRGGIRCSSEPGKPCRVHLRPDVAPGEGMCVDRFAPSAR